MKLSHDYIRGLVDGEGCFTFCSDSRFGERTLIPTFTLAMNVRDVDLIESVKETLGLRNIVHRFKPRVRPDGYKRGGMAVLIVELLRAEARRIRFPLALEGRESAFSCC